MESNRVKCSTAPVQSIAVLRPVDRKGRRIGRGIDAHQFVCIKVHRPVILHKTMI